uniref:Uncharacterized protein n=1 Tax=Pipistrellus kuhlii TaxID=59472 RepID=A0A7J7SUN1_PIPKU|nr:hypothetical protein mPipKuh1_009768 [Pipistrellus kuhlii]
MGWHSTKQATPGRARVLFYGFTGEHFNQFRHMNVFLFCFVVFVNLHLRIFIPLLSRESGREGGRGKRAREREREKHQCERDTWIGCLQHTPNWQPNPGFQADTLTKVPHRPGGHIHVLVQGFLDNQLEALIQDLMMK